MKKVVLMIIACCLQTIFLFARVSAIQSGRLNAPLLTNEWIGNTSNNWNQPLNWSLGHVPASSENVIVNTGYTFYPVISYGTATCSNLSIGEGAKISLGDADLDIAGDMTIMGQVEETSPNADFMVSGSVFWDAGSTANVTAGEFRVEGDWEFSSGALANLANGTVLFTGSTNQYIRNYTAACSFFNLTNDKTTGILYFSNASSDTTKINGTLRNENSLSVLHCRSSHPVLLKGQFTNNGHLYCQNGTFIFNGTTHSINLNTGDYFKNLIIKSTGNTSLVDSLRVQGNLTISSGALVAGAWPILITGNWTNSLSPAAFNEGSGKVVFNGSGNQYVYGSENFNTLELNPGGKLIINNTSWTVTCNQYKWTSGGVEVQTGTFTANDLVQDGIYGNFWLYPGGTINLNSDQFVDLKGYLHIYGGTFNILGLAGNQSQWAYGANGGIEMSDGVLDFKNTGILVYNTGFTFTENITGGTIRTTGSLSIQIAGFTPSGGTFELYGNEGNSYIQTINGGYLHNLCINKEPLINANISSSLDINGDLTIISGCLYSWGDSIRIAGNWENRVGAGGFLANTCTVMFDGANAKNIIGNETFFNLSVNKTFSGFNGLTLADDITVTNDLAIEDGCIELDEPADLFIGGNITIASGAGLNANDSYGPQITVAGNWTNYNNGYTSATGFSPGYSTVTFNGTAAYQDLCAVDAVQQDFYHLRINKMTGTFRSDDNLTILGNLYFDSGVWEDDMDGLTHKISGNVTLGIYAFFNTLTNGNTLEFSGAGNAVLTINSTNNIFRHIKINKTGGSSVTQHGNMDLLNTGNLTIQQGHYILDESLVSVTGDVAVNESGVLSVGASGSLLILSTHNLTVNQGGKLEIVGTGDQPATIGVYGAGWYNLNVNSGGVIAADYGVFTNPGINGVNVAPGAIVDPLHAFTGCSFRMGIAGGTYLTINNSQSLTIYDADFPHNIFGSASNITKTSDSGRVYCINTNGLFSGEPYDNDPFDRIDWVPPVMWITGNITEFYPACYYAIDTVTVGGAGSFFRVYPGGDATIIAGKTILFLQGTTVLPGGYLHGFISPDYTYCDNVPLSKASVVTGEPDPDHRAADTPQFIIFPNPAHEKFTLEKKVKPYDEPVRVEVLDMHGSRILMKEYPTFISQEFRIDNRPSGMYFVKVRTNEKTEVYKLILNR